MGRYSVTYRMLYNIHILCTQVYKNYKKEIEILDEMHLDSHVTLQELLDYRYTFIIDEVHITVNILNILSDLCYLFNINHTNLSVSEGINQIIWAADVRDRKNTMPKVEYFLDL